MDTFERNRCRHLLLFFTRGVSLRTWVDVGMFDREVALYRRLYEHGIRTTFVTYGDERDLVCVERIPGIDVCCRRPGIDYSQEQTPLPWLSRELLDTADLIKSNQTDGAETALQAARMAGKPLIARCGYMWSEFATRLEGADSAAATQSAEIEARVFGAADGVIVTTPAMRNSIVQRLPELSECITIIPNYVDTDVFHPHNARPAGPPRLCYVGRLDQRQKNLRSLLTTVAQLDVELELIGDGPLRRECEEAQARNPRITLSGNLPNTQLPERLQRASAFVLPSFYEGHPKALIEAMSCGTPVVATDVPGVRELVRHGETGWLCEPDAESLRVGIRTVLNDQPLAQRLSLAARRFVEDQFSLSRVVEMELRAYQQVLNEDRRRARHALPCAAVPYP